MRGHGAVAVLAFVLIGGVVAATAAGAPPNPASPSKPVSSLGPAMLAMGDLAVTEIVVDSAPLRPGGFAQLTVKYNISSSAVPYWNRMTAVGKAWLNAGHASDEKLFALGLEMRELPNGVFHGAGDHGRCWDIHTMLSPGQRQLWKCEVTVPLGKQFEFRATVDIYDWYEESEKSNNSKTVVWPAVLPTPALHR